VGVVDAGEGEFSEIRAGIGHGAVSLCGLLDVSQVLLELVESFPPDLPVPLNPFDGGVQWRRLEPAGPVLGVAASVINLAPSSTFKCFETACRLNVKGLGELVDRSLPARQPGEDRPAGGIGEGGEGGAQGSSATLFNLSVAQLIRLIMNGRPGAVKPGCTRRTSWRGPCDVGAVRSA